MKKIPIVEDSLLLERYMHGDEKAFERFMTNHRVQMRIYIRTLITDWSYVNDLLQDAYIKIFETLRKKQFDSSKNAKSWAFTIVRNVCLDFNRLRERRPKLKELDPIQLKAALLLVDEEVTDLFCRQDIIDAIQKLSPEHQHIITLYLFEDLSTLDLVEKTGLPSGTVKTRIRASKKQLQKLLHVHK